MTAVCKHGQLARSCEICGLQRELTRVQNKYIELAERDHSVMDAALRERTEACAKLCEGLLVNRPDDPPANYYDGGLRSCAVAIRALLDP